MILIPKDLMDKLTEFAKENKIAMFCLGNRQTFMIVMSNEDSNPNYVATHAASLCLEAILSGVIVEQSEALLEDEKLNSSKPN